jgi:hypothetical protein
MYRIVLRVAIIGLVVLILVSSASAMAAANRVPVTAVEDVAMPITANDLKPPECASLNLTEIVIWPDTIWGESSSHLVLGTSGTDLIFGGSGSDCILGGGGGDLIFAGAGSDVCIGGPGTDTFSGCEVQYQ